MCEIKEPWADFVGYDLFGYEYNCKYPPDIDRFGNEHQGYATENQLAFFYDFCILQYGIAFQYGEDDYEAEFTENGPILTNRTTGSILGPFEDAVKLLEEANVGGNKLINIIDDLKELVLH